MAAAAADLAAASSRLGAAAAGADAEGAGVMAAVGGDAPLSTTRRRRCTTRPCRGGGEGRLPGGVADGQSGRGGLGEWQAAAAAEPAPAVAGGRRGGGGAYRIRRRRCRVSENLGAAKRRHARDFGHAERIARHNRQHHNPGRATTGASGAAAPPRPPCPQQPRTRGGALPPPGPTSHAVTPPPPRLYRVPGRYTPAAAATAASAPISASPRPMAGAQAAAGTTGGGGARQRPVGKGGQAEGGGYRRCGSDEAPPEAVNGRGEARADRGGGRWGGVTCTAGAV
ncbi:hypothetical protein BU14_0113s0013 [Porphyra umbilicalis]|uniref:Uncharacterized protein n=1 Tax=Porphyra umbilicalis TaxID=2786 RepID=A0A1X6PBH2_PORUM|nr:hypothetical protein BU14_0113s0013 [Porphyra umbilicalis]|eukprot:OSX78269.1 hypothetical protein BU14_0113s0013 [Porphyra umbilicalis]